MEGDARDLFVMEGVVPRKTDSGVVVRSLRSDDGPCILSVLAQLTTVGEVSLSSFAERFGEMKAAGSYFIVVAEIDGKIVGCATLTVELKFIHSAGKLGHIEDVVVVSTERGRNIGRSLVSSLTDIARSRGCYKVTLDCLQHNVEFYLKCGLVQSGVQMVQYL